MLVNISKQNNRLWMYLYLIYHFRRQSTEDVRSAEAKPISGQFAIRVIHSLEVFVQ